MSIKDFRQRRKLVREFILKEIDADGYTDTVPETDAEKLQFLADTFKSEYGWAIERYGVTGAIREWLMGLPSVLTLPFYNSDVLEFAVKFGYLTDESEEGRDDAFLKGYWQIMAREVAGMFFDNKISIQEGTRS